MLFSKEVKKCCQYCTMAIEIGREDRVLCSKKGPVMSDFSCKKYEYDPIKRNPKAKVMLNYSENDFLLK